MMFVNAKHQASAQLCTWQFLSDASISTVMRMVKDLRRCPTVHLERVRQLVLHRLCAAPSEDWGIHMQGWMLAMRCLPSFSKDHATFRMVVFVCEYMSYKIHADLHDDHMASPGQGSVRNDIHTAYVENAIVHHTNWHLLVPTHPWRFIQPICQAVVSAARRRGATRSVLQDWVYTVRLCVHTTMWSPTMWEVCSGDVVTLAATILVVLQRLWLECMVCIQLRRQWSYQKMARFVSQEEWQAATPTELSLQSTKPSITTCFLTFAQACSGHSTSNLFIHAFTSDQHSVLSRTVLPDLHHRLIVLAAAQTHGSPARVQTALIQRAGRASIRGAKVVVSIDGPPIQETYRQALWDAGVSVVHQGGVVLMKDKEDMLEASVGKCGVLSMRWRDGHFALRPPDGKIKEISTVTTGMAPLVKASPELRRLPDNLRMWMQVQAGQGVDVHVHGFVASAAVLVMLVYSLQTSS